MQRISVVFTVHAENGLANVSELVSILERIAPEVVFLEIPTSTVVDEFNPSRNNLESTAVSRYCENHHVDLIPVDLPTPEADFFTRTEVLFEAIEKRSPDYCRLVDWHSQYVSRHGFAYLNSQYCSDLSSKLHEAIQAAIDEFDDHRLAESCALWIGTNERREREMMKNIENHSRHASFRRAAFLVGAAHRQSIIDLSRGGPGADSSTIEWDFVGFIVEQALTESRHNEEL
jgi:hypothetical protein